MKVKELIERLLQEDPEMKVFSLYEEDYDGEDGYCCYYNEIECFSKKISQ